MNVTCPNCASVFRVDPSKIPDAGVRARCSICSAVFAVRREGETKDRATAPTSGSGGAPAVHASASSAAAPGSQPAAPVAARPPAPSAPSTPAQYAPAQPNGGPWTEELTRQAGEGLIDVLAQYAPNMRAVIRDWVLFTPADIERRVGMTGGHIRHIDMVAGQLFNQRPLPGWANYATPIEGLYLCGADTHPGGEVTGAPGHNAAQAVLRELAQV